MFFCGVGATEHRQNNTGANNERLITVSWSSASFQAGGRCRTFYMRWQSGGKRQVNVAVP